jgi:hypothetical protein
LLGGLPTLGTQIPTAAIGTTGGIPQVGLQIPLTSAGVSGGLPLAGRQIPTATIGAVGSLLTTTSAIGITTTNYIDMADTFLDRDMGLGIDSGSATTRTTRQALRFLRNKWIVSTASTLTVYKEDDTAVSWTSNVSSLAGADPIVGSDPA